MNSRRKVSIEDRILNTFVKVSTVTGKVQEIGTGAIKLAVVNHRLTALETEITITNKVEDRINARIASYKAFRRTNR